MSAPRTFAARGPLLATTLFALLMVSPILAAEPVDDVFAAQLAAGEFAPAFAAARAIDDPALRDERLEQLAAAQARAGGREEAALTLSVVKSDERRSAAIRSTLVPNKNRDGAAGGAQADFDSLIDLITTTVRPQSWDEVGGPGTISPFQNGVYVDVDGTLRRAIAEEKATGLAVARLEALRAKENKDPRQRSAFRKVSLTRLEKHVQLQLALGYRPDDEMRHLAGLEKIKYVLVYPETGDLVLVGPAGPWRTDNEGRDVSRHSGRPVLQLDDLVVLLRLMHSSPQATFACSINPTQDGLARTKAFADKSSAAPLAPGQRGEWLQQLRESMGRQTISVEGIDPRTRVARVLVEADYRMKLVGMGLEEGTADVPSYLELIRARAGKNPPALSVLRWWFTLKYDAVTTTKDRDAFEIRGPGVQVLSENELLTQLGERVHTGASDVTNQEFASRFTSHFGDLAKKYPVYADLENIFDLALVAALIERQGLADRIEWHMTCLGDPRSYAVALGTAPASVESVINHVRTGGKHLIVGVSGGVRAEPARYVSEASLRTDRYGRLENGRAASAARDLPPGAWWWD